MPLNFCEITTLDLSYVVPVKSTLEFSKNFMAFSEYTYDLSQRIQNGVEMIRPFQKNSALTIQRQLLKAITLIDLKISLDYGNFCWAFYHTRNLFLLRLQKPAVSKPSRVYLRQRPNYLVSSDSLQKTSSSPIPSVLFCGRYVMHKWQYTEWVAQ